MRFLLFIFLGMLLLPSISQAKPFENGQELKERCGTFNTFDSGFCTGYIEGVHDSIAGLAESGQIPKPFCLPKGMTSEKLETIVESYMKTRLMDLDFSAAYAVYQALSAFYGCES